MYTLKVYTMHGNVKCEVQDSAWCGVGGQGRMEENGALEGYRRGFNRIFQNDHHEKFSYHLSPYKDIR